MHYQLCTFLHKIFIAHKRIVSNHLHTKEAGDRNIDFLSSHMIDFDNQINLNMVSALFNSFVGIFNLRAT